MFAEPRYRVARDIVIFGQKRWMVFDSQRSAGTGRAHILCSCDAEADANAIAAALNSAEDAGRVAEAVINAHDALCEVDESSKAARAALAWLHKARDIVLPEYVRVRHALKAETKESTTNAE